ncbi:MAG: serine protease [Azoarcus sp.]|nr:serine protease [Azoarcus sp.]
MLAADDKDRDANAAVQAQGSEDAGRSLSAAAERVFGEAQPRLLQIRTVLKSAQKQASIGSGFLVSTDGRALTNYHVLALHALEPTLYQIEYRAADGSRGSLRLLAIDIDNDLAVVQLDAPSGKPFEAFDFARAAVEGRLVKGERLFSMGNPLDLGFTIVEGTYNGRVDKSYQAREHFTGVLNPGMSGGPTVTGDNRVVGVNVARSIDGDLVSFLAPAEAAVRLLEKARSGGEMDAAAVRGEIGAQMDVWQKAFFAALEAQGFRETALGPYRVAESKADWFNCWAHTNRDEWRKLRILINRSSCNTHTQLFLGNDVYAGGMEISHAYFKSVDLDALQFSRRLRARHPYFPGGASNRYTPFRCHDDFLASGEGSPQRPALRVSWCARGYRDFPGLYDVSVVAVTQDHDREALVSNATLTGVQFGNALAFTRGFLAALKVRRDLD